MLVTSKMMLSTLSGSQERANTTTMETNKAWVRDCFLIFSRSLFSCICKTVSACSFSPFPTSLPSSNACQKRAHNFLIKKYGKVYALKTLGTGNSCHSIENCIFHNTFWYFSQFESRKCIECIYNWLYSVVCTCRIITLLMNVTEGKLSTHWPR